MNYHFDDFTEKEYKKNLITGKASWDFICFEKYKDPGKSILLRHDVDFSLQRALRLAEIENDLDIKSTYFLSLHSYYYNLLEPGVDKIIFKIKELGHDFGLHFVPLYYKDMASIDEFKEKLAFEKNIIENIFSVEIKALSLHNPSLSQWLNITEDNICGMVNTYGDYIKNNYLYVSDSNGYWRFRRLKDVFESKGNDKLHILIHPGWWTPEAMSPRKRFLRCIEGRSKKFIDSYDHNMKINGRLNVDD